MAKIYTEAARVIVWLGDAERYGEEAPNELRVAVVKGSWKGKKKDTSPAVKHLLQRPWFERVLQEVAAARQVTIKCGHAEIDGDDFCQGIEAVILPATDKLDLIRNVCCLIKDAGLRPRYDLVREQGGDRFSLKIAPWPNF
ncbi:hypothetical protein B0T14DRAFT_565838 [Immersiella caudata]|uniref:Heterokaryon incompatibility domain-containing protein n=1 Tax=Immersiella caudata TaxID=314043 RepID=A0AA40BYT6_9PEZI|nr:hypothetical protein B0T14DRAFT_565838 [Immersiella caudata]